MQIYTPVPISVYKVTNHVSTDGSSDANIGNKLGSATKSNSPDE